MRATWRAAGENAVDLSRVIAALRPLGVERWRLERVECAGDLESARRLQAAADLAGQIDTSELELLASRSVQVIDGVFRGHSPVEDVDIEFEAIDGTWWDIGSSKAEVVTQVVRQLGEPAHITKNAR